MILKYLLKKKTSIVRHTLLITEYSMRAHLALLKELMLNPPYLICTSNLTWHILYLILDIEIKLLLHNAMSVHLLGIYPLIF